MPRAFRYSPIGSNRTQKFALLDGERADREIDRRALLQQQQRFEHGERILAAR